MPFRVHDISNALFERLRQIDENHYFEAKEAVRFEPIAKAISAFANADGGRLIVGLPDKKAQSRVGVNYPNQEAANGHITEITKMFSQAPDTFSIDFMRTAGQSGLLMDVSVEKCAAVISTPAGEIYIRRNAQNIRL